MIESITDFAKMIFSLLKSDRDCIIGVGGFTGEGKSTFTSKLCKEYAKVANTYWGFDRMTWQRKEMMRWIDGEGPNKEGRLPEYSVILPDELFMMFYRRQWYQDEQIDAISTFNMCRDRHLMVAGNVPNFWDLDGAFIHRIRFYVYVPERGVAWVFEQENNPFVKDPWNVSENIKMFRKYKGPNKCPNFICELRFDDWDVEEKESYYAIRNEKRVIAVQENQKIKVEKYRDCKQQRDNAILALCQQAFWKDERGNFKRFSQVGVAELTGCTSELVQKILNPQEKRNHETSN